MPLVAGIQALGNVASSALSYIGQKNANKANKQLAREQMDFQAAMANTAYQRAMTDAQKAGLNPILTASGGGASAPTGATATIENQMGEIGNSINNALNAWQIKKQNELTDAQINNIKEETKQTKETTKNIQTETKIKEAEAKGRAETEKIIEEKRQKLEKSPLGWITAAMRSLEGGINTTSNVANTISNIRNSNAMSKIAKRK